MGCSQNYGPLLAIDYITALIFRGTRVGPNLNFGKYPCSGTGFRDLGPGHTFNSFVLGMGVGIG